MRRFASGVGVLLVVFLGTASSANAGLVTIGSPLTGEFSKATFLKDQTLANVALEAGTATSPVSGVIVRWRISGGEGNYFRLRILRPSFLGDYTAITSSAPQLPEGGVRTYATLLPIKAGDIIGLDAAEDASLGVRYGTPGKTLSAFWFPRLAEGQFAYPSATSDEQEFAFNADVLPPPSVTGVSPATATFDGGTTVTIGGANFMGASAVSFGSVPAASFSVIDDGTITAVAPSSPRGPVNVSVTTIAGTGTAARAFSFTACVVPRLKWKSLKAAKRQLKREGCRVGKVSKRKGVTAKTGDVVRQGRRAGKYLPPGTKVNITLGKRQPPEKVGSEPPVKGLD